MRFVGSLLALALLAACGQGSTGRSDATEYVGRATVLESPKHGPQLCVAVADSLPPQCGGPDITNWTWKKAAGEETANGTTWGDYVVYGTFADGDFTLTRDPADPDSLEPGDVDDGERDFATPCPAPPDGWLPEDRERFDDDESARAIDRAARLAESIPGYSELWVDSSHAKHPELNLAHDVILNVRVMGDTEAATRTMRTVWKGALCVSAAKHTDTELRRIQKEVHERAGELAFSSSAGDDRVDLDVFLDEGGKLQKEFDEEYGKGVVRVTSALRPAPPGV